MTSGLRKKLAREALLAALETRRSTRRSSLEALCIYDVAEELAVDVWFQALPSLEGMYSKEPGPAILLGSERPATRRVYTCAHELGHHVFGHCTSVDELPVDGSSRPIESIPEEFVAQTFAGFLLMPKLAVQSAFISRGWSLAAATPEEVYRIANVFGVGYQTLISHLSFCLGLITADHAQRLAKTKLKEIRAAVAAEDMRRPLIIVDSMWKGRAVDTEIGDIILAPAGSDAEGDVLRPLRSSSRGTFWEPSVPGLGRLVQREIGWAANVRVSRQGFSGRACFRHLPEGANNG